VSRSAFAGKRFTGSFPLRLTAIDEEAEALLERQCLSLEARTFGNDGGRAALLVERLGHAGEAERGEALAGGVGEHGRSPSQW
jgi:hypothetical protein